MNKREAYSILDLKEGCTLDEAKKSFKKKAAKLHPDVNKEPDAEKKFKELNQAFDVVKKNIENPTQETFNYQRSTNSYNMNNDFFDFTNNFVNFHVTNLFSEFSPRDISKIINVNLYDVLNSKKIDVSYPRKIGCDNCNGKRVIDKKRCDACSGNGYKQTFFSGSIVLNSEMENGLVLRVSEGGDSLGTVKKDAYFTLNIIPPPGFIIQGPNVIAEVIVPFKAGILGESCNISFNGKDYSIKIPEKSTKSKQVMTNIKAMGKNNLILVVHVNEPTDDDLNKIREIYNGT